MEEDDNKKNKKCKKQINKNSGAYLKQREKANARKRKFLDKMTFEQREMKRAKDREYYQRRKAEKKIRSISEMTEKEKRQQRKVWKKNSQKYREKKRQQANIINNTPPDTDDENNNLPVLCASRKTLGRKTVKKGRAKAYRTIKKQGIQISKMQRKIDSLRKKLARNIQRVEKKAKKKIDSPKTKVKELVKDSFVTSEVQRKLLFGEILVSQLKENSNTFPKNSKEKEVFQKWVNGERLKKYKLYKVAKTFSPKTGIIEIF